LAREATSTCWWSFQSGARLGLRYFALEQELSDLLGRPVDLNTPGFLSLDFRDEVRASAEVIYDVGS
jgi:predicted nucleotidyltransferase